MTTSWVQKTKIVFTSQGQGHHQDCLVKWKDHKESIYKNVLCFGGGCCCCWEEDYQRGGWSCFCKALRYLYEGWSMTTEAEAEWRRRRHSRLLERL